MAKISPMLAAIMQPEKRPSAKQLTKEHAQHSMRRATEDWVDGRITTKQHTAVHARGKHVLAGKQPAKFKGKSGERQIPKVVM